MNLRNDFSASTSSEPDWEYSGTLGPSHWGEIKQAYALCANGLNQSPIDLLTNSVVVIENNPVRINWPPIPSHGMSVEYNFVGQCVGEQMLMPSSSPSSVMYQGKRYKLANFHFHAHSEHQLDSEKSALEIHFLHTAADQTHLVLGVLVEKGAWTSDFLTQFQKDSNDNFIEFDSLLNELNGFSEVYAYMGSLTTPPCTEGTIWKIPTTRLSITQSDLDFILDSLPKNSHRPLQTPNMSPASSSNNAVEAFVSSGKRIALILLFFNLLSNLL
jgi:carbonic anhydrase